MFHSTLRSLCTLLCLLNATKASDLLKDLDLSFPPPNEGNDDGIDAKPTPWHLPNLWRKANVDDGKTLIDPLNNETSVFSRVGERLSDWQKRIWNPLPHNDTADAPDNLESTEPSSWLDKFMRKRTTQNNTQSVVSDNQIVDAQYKNPELGHTVPEEPITPDVVNDAEQWKSGMPDAKLMDGLRCVPVVSFTACLDHCFAVLPAAAEGGEDMTSALIPPAAEPRKWYDTSAFYANLWGSQSTDQDEEKLEKDARSAGRKNQMRDNGPAKVLDWAQREQLNLCLFSVCARDYLKAALPGCIDPSGSLVSPSHRVNRTDLAPDSNYEELNFYNPQKLSFYADLGYFTFSRLWSNFFPEGAVSSWLMLPIWLICLLIMPILIITWANPTASSHSPVSSGRRQSSEFEPNVHMCEDLLARHPSWRWVQKTIHTLSNCAELLITFGYSLGFFISGLLAGTAVHRLLPVQGLSSDQVEMTSARSAIKRPDGYHSLAQQDRC